jgi:hypothetical protein
VSDTPRRIVSIPLPAAGTAVYLGGVDPVAEMIASAHAELDRQREADERKRLAVLADAERLANTRRARVARRFKGALKMFARSR